MLVEEAASTARATTGQVAQVATLVAVRVVAREATQVTEGRVREDSVVVKRAEALSVVVRVRVVARMVVAVVAACEGTLETVAVGTQGCRCCKILGRTQQAVRCDPDQ